MVCGRFDGDSWYQYNENNGLPYDSVSKIAVDRQGGIWVEHRNGVSCVHPDSIETYTTENGLPASGITAIAVDHDNIKWFGTFSDGLIRYDGQSWVSYKMDNGLTSNRIISMASDKQNRMWIGTDNGVSCFDGGTWVSYTIDDGLPHNYIYSIAVSGDTVWIGTRRGLACFDGEKWITLLTDTPLFARGGVTCDKDNVKWFYNYDGVTRFDGLNWSVYSVEDFFPGESD